MLTRRAPTNKTPIDTPSASTLARAYVAFLELPVPLVLLVLWVSGALLEGLCVVALYEAGLVLARMVGTLL
jgi:hypothetical protein